MPACPERLGLPATGTKGRIATGALDGKVAIVTGTSRVVGVGISRQLLPAGATVVGRSRRPLPDRPAVSPTIVSFGAAKCGLDHLTRSLAEEWGPKARVDCLALGPTMTDDFRAFVLPSEDPSGRECFPKVPLERAGEPDELGRACVFPGSGEADDINGTTIEIDGGTLRGVLYEARLKTIIDLL